MIGARVAGVFSLPLSCCAQTFVKHFDCRTLSPDRVVLESDYSIECFSGTVTSLWWVLAAVSAVGVAAVSLGLPLGLFAIMYRDMQSRLRAIDQNQLSLATAFRSHRRKYEFVAGEFRPEACEDYNHHPKISVLA